ISKHKYHQGNNNEETHDLCLLQEFITQRFPWIISINKKITWPPSNAGIGRIFINANAIESIPTKLQNLNQSTSVPNMVAIPTGPESALSARTSPLKIFPKPLILSVITEKALLAPSGKDSIKPYLC